LGIALLGEKRTARKTKGKPAMKSAPQEGEARTRENTPADRSWKSPWSLKRVIIWRKTKVSGGGQERNPLWKQPPPPLGPRMVLNGRHKRVTNSHWGKDQGGKGLGGTTIMRRPEGVTKPSRPAESRSSIGGRNGKESSKKTNEAVKGTSMLRRKRAKKGAAPPSLNIRRIDCNNLQVDEVREGG